MKQCAVFQSMAGTTGAGPGGWSDAVSGPLNMTGPYVPLVMGFEEEFEAPVAKAWMQRWWHVSMIASAIYAVVIHAGQHAMKSRPPFRLRSAMVLWSGVLAVFSICGSIRTLPNVWHVYRHHGLYPTICSPRFYYFENCCFWSWAFAVSKLFELGDTAFIVLRKQKLSFLHWYHHITVLVYCWYGYGFDSPSGNVFGAMNFFVHALMYTYYTLRALRVAVPYACSMLLTSLQILQMLVGVTVSALIFRVRVSAGAGACAETDNVLLMAFGMYFSYLLLFLHFFYEKYLLKPASKPSSSSSSSSNGSTKPQSNGSPVTNGVHNNNHHKSHIKTH